MKKNKIYLILLMLIISSFSSLAITEFGDFIRDEEIQLLQVCASCTFNNISSIKAPNSTIIIRDVEMQRQNSNYNYTLSPQSNLGEYNVCGVGDLDGINTIWCYVFDVTVDGTPNAEEILETNNNLQIIVVFIVVIMIFLIFGYFNDAIGLKGITYRLLGYSVAFIELITLLLIIYLTELEQPITNILKINFYMIFVLVGGISLIALWLFVFRLVNVADDPEDNRGDELDRKWRNR